MTEISHSVDSIALKQAEAIAYFAESIEAVIQGLKSLALSLTGDQITEVNTYISTLEAVLRSVEAYEIPSDQILEMKTKVQSRSKIERLRLSAEIIRLREVEKLSFEQIATRLGISSSTVSKFYNYYVDSKPAEKARMKKVSIFDAVQNLEDLNVMIYRQLARLEYSDPENHVRYISEARQLIKLAMDYVTAINHLQEVNAIKTKVKEILLKLAPEVREEVIKAFATDSKVIGILN